METTYIEIDSPDKHLSDVLEEIPSNVILYKTLTGIGATYSEIKGAPDKPCGGLCRC